MNKHITTILLSSLLLLMLNQTAFAAKKTYQLTPKKVAENIYVFIGKTEHFNFKNGGNIVNTGFIIGDDAVIVIDSGPSFQYGREMRAAIAKVTDKPIGTVLITHFHPDHFLGNQAYQDANILALNKTVKGIQQQGELFNDAMYRLVGHWMKGTEVLIPKVMDFQPKLTLHGRTLSLLQMQGHSGSDLLIFDEKSQALFAGDTVFHQRTPTTPHAKLDQWLQELAQLSQFNFKVLVPGHGPVVKDQRAIKQTSDYLAWLQQSLVKAAEQGTSMAEVLTADTSGQQFFSLAVFAEEYPRSVAHLYPAIEQKILAQGHVKQSEP